MSRKIVTVRHGERMDFTFTDEWVQTCFDNAGNYRRQNLNHPETVPKRYGAPETFIMDTPLTQIGSFQARLTGSGLRQENVLAEGFEVYVSPTLRCIETATSILKGLGVEKKLKIEPCLFEWTQWYAGRMPHWMTKEEFKNAGFKIDDEYKPLLPLNNLIEGETAEIYYRRSFELILHLLSKSDKDLLLVAHGSSLDANSRLLLGHPVRTAEEMVNVARLVPYCAVSVTEYDLERQQWQLANAPKLSICHSSIYNFDARGVLLGSECAETGAATSNSLTMHHH